MKIRAWTVGLVLVLGVTVARWSVVRAVEDTGSDEEAAVRLCVEKYFRGVSDGEEVLLNAAWDVRNGHMSFVETRGETETIKTVPIASAVNWWTRVKADTSSSRVLDLDIVDDRMAMVKLEFKYNKLHYIEYLTLLKAEGEWKLVNKAYVKK